MSTISEICKASPDTNAGIAGELKLLKATPSTTAANSTSPEELTRTKR